MSSDVTESFRPSAIEVNKESLQVVKAVGEESGIENRPRLYGMAMEYASENREEFLEYLKSRGADS